MSENVRVFFNKYWKNVKLLFNKQWKMLEYFSQKNQTLWHCTNYKPISWPQKELTRKLNKNPTRDVVEQSAVTGLMICSGLELFIYSKKSSRSFYHILFWNDLWVLFVKASIALRLTTMSRKNHKSVLIWKNPQVLLFKLVFFTSHIIMDNQKLI